MKGTQMTMLLKNNWQFTVDQKDMTLILKALGGRLDHKEEELADALCDKLTRMRINQTREILRQLDGLEMRLEEKLAK